MTSERYEVSVFMTVPTTYGVFDTVSKSYPAYIGSRKIAFRVTDRGACERDAAWLNDVTSGDHREASDV